MTCCIPFLYSLELFLASILSFYVLFTSLSFKLSAGFMSWSGFIFSCYASYSVDLFSLEVYIL